MPRGKWNKEKAIKEAEENEKEREQINANRYVELDTESGEQGDIL